MVADRRSLAQVKAEFCDCLRQGHSINESLAIVGRQRQWYADNHRRDLEWRAKVDTIRRLVRDGGMPTEIPDFPEFCDDYLGMHLWDHQLNMFDVLEGRSPRWLDPAMTYTEGLAGHRRVLINVPPNHAKTMTVSISYVLWRILQDKDMSVLIISKTQAFAAKVLWAIKQRLTSARYADLQLAFGPPGGFRGSADQWSQTRLYLWGDERDSDSKDPTIEAVGIGGQVYGARAKLILVDDAVVLSNAAAWPAHMDWLRQEVATRIGPDDQLAVIGTRVAAVDLYRELMNPDHYNDADVPWTYLGMPAVLEYASTPKKWRTLWPVADQPFSDSDLPFDGLNYHRWTGERMAKVRNEIGPRKWALVYLQQSVEEDATFDAVSVRAVTDYSRMVGPLSAGVANSPYVICSMDPAVVGNTAACVYAVDRLSGQRWMLDMKVVTGPTPKQIREMIEELTEKYQPQEWVIEANAFQLALVQDETINRFLASRGVVMRPHYTHSQNRKDEKYGVASMSTLLGTTRRPDGTSRIVHQGDNLVSFPNPAAAGVKQFLDELLIWTPEAKAQTTKMDTVMAWWFAELRARELVSLGKRTAFQRNNRFLSQRDLDRRYTVNLSDAAALRKNDANTVYM